MKKIRRRLGSLVLALAMMCSLLSGAGISAYAAEEMITEVKVKVDIPYPGKDVKVSYSSEEPGKYEVKTIGSDSWLLGNVDKTDEILSGNAYGALFEVTTKDGYELAQTAVVKATGAEEYVGLQQVIVREGEKPVLHFEVICSPKVLGEVSEINLTSVPAPVVGEKAIPYSETGEHYTAAGAWKVYDAATQTYKPVAEDYTFKSGDCCDLEITVKLEAGYALTDNCDLKINGEWADYQNGNYQMTGIHCYTALSEETMNEFTILSKDIPAPVIGKSFSGDISIPVPEGSPYTITGHWEDEDGNAEGTFEKGKSYWFLYTARVKEGYAFAEEIILEDDQLGSRYASTDLVTVKDVLRFSLAEMIDKVSLDMSKKPAVGDEIPETVSLIVPSDANYSAEGYWLDEDGNLVSGKFEDGKLYLLNISVKPGEGCEFARPVEVTMDGVKRTERPIRDGSLDFYREYSFKTMIDKVEVTGVSSAEVGKPADVSALKVPEGANYEIEEAWWQDADTGETPTVFEKGHAYNVDVVLRPKEGYGFADNADCFIEGKKCKYTLRALDFVQMSETVSFKDVIDEIRIDNVPEMKIGEQSKTDITFPADANYAAYAQWYVWDDTNGFEGFEGEFEAGKLYELEVFVYPDEGYAFSEKETAFYVNGKDETDAARINLSSAAYHKDFSTGLKVIDKIEITAEKPAAGSHDSIASVPKVAEGANYELHESYFDWLEGNASEWVYFGGHFKADGNYGFMFVVDAKEGYVFAEDVQVVVNGVTLTADCYEGNAKETTGRYFFNMMPDADSDADSNGGTPDTGDQAAMELFTMMFVLSGAGLVFMNLSMKRRKYR